jgi:hypothetical protein
MSAVAKVVGLFGTWPWHLRPSLREVGLQRSIGWHLFFLGCWYRWRWFAMHTHRLRHLGLKMWCSHLTKEKHERSTAGIR